jgi:voltage-gated potassium channel Kch
VTDAGRPPSRTREDRRAVRREVVTGVARAVLTSAAIITAYYVIPVRGGSGVDSAVRVVIGAAAVPLVAIWEVRAVASAARPVIRAIDALAVSVTTMVVAFAVLYLNQSAQDPAAFTEHLGRTDALYFTMTTLTTIGYGDIAALTGTARVAVMVQMLFNVAVIGTSARLIVSTARRSGGRPRPS